MKALEYAKGVYLCRCNHCYHAFSTTQERKRVCQRCRSLQMQRYLGRQFKSKKKEGQLNDPSSQYILVD